MVEISTTSEGPTPLPEIQGYPVCTPTYYYVVGRCASRRALRPCYAFASEAVGGTRRR